MPSYHAVLSPSSADRWTSCSASINAQRGRPNVHNKDSQDGTCCHQILAELLADPTLDPHRYVGRTMLFWQEVTDERDEQGRPIVLRHEDWLDLVDAMFLRITGRTVVTDTMVDMVMVVHDYVRERQALTGAIMEIEQRVPIGQFTDEEDAGGTSDITLIHAPFIEVIDAKFGRNKVHAFKVIRAAHTDLVMGDTPEIRRANLQMSCYALGAAEKFADHGPFTHVTMTIVQPFAHHASDYSCSMDELREVEEFLRQGAAATRDNPVYQPDTDNCHYCRASGDCPSQSGAVLSMVNGEDLPLGILWEKLPMVNDWVEAVTKRMWDTLEKGVEIPRRADGIGYVLGEGKSERRGWSNEEAAERALERLGLPPETMYVKRLISPAEAETLSKSKRAPKGQKPVAPVIGKGQWSALQELIPKPGRHKVIMLETDPRPRVDKTAGFDDVPSDDSDIFN